MTIRKFCFNYSLCSINLKCFKRFSCLYLSVIGYDKLKGFMIRFIYAQNTMAYDAFCYQFLDTLRLNWTDAEKTCSNQSQGHLAAINGM